MLFDAYPHVYAGAQRIDHMLARQMPDRGWALTTVTTGSGPFVTRLIADGLPVQVVQVPAALSRYGRTTIGLRRARALVALPWYWVRLLRALRGLRPRVVHVTDHRGLVLAGVPARLSGARLVWHIHAVHRGRLLNALGARLAHCTLVPSRAIIATMPELRRCRDLRAVGNIVPPAARRDRPVDLATSPVIATTARLHPDKGLDLLIDALALVRREIPEASVHIIGGPQAGFEHLADELRDRAARQGVAEAVDLLGFVDQPQVVVASARCYVQPARERTEILPLALLEAMAIGVPVVATDVGAVRTVVRDGATGLLVPPEDVPALAAALVRVLRDSSEADRLRTAAFELLAHPRFDQRSLVDGVVAAYDGTPSDG